MSVIPKPFRKTASLDGATGTTKEKGTTGPQIIRDFRDQIKKGSAFSLDSIASVVDAIRHTESIDDRKFLLEHALIFVSRLEDGPLQQTLQNKIVELLYSDLAHPPATCIGNKYAWRTADGSYNNIQSPDMGKAGTPYARSVQQSHPLPQNRLPDPGLVFDTLLKRDGFVKHPAGLSSLMFSFAALVIHSIFRTSHKDVNINETSSYVDLAPLYGNDQESQNLVRKRDGRGLLHPDVFAEDRLLLLPPAVCALLALFNRNHNYIAKRLLEINERGTYVDPSTLSTDEPAQKAQLIAQEEELFQIARLINCGWFASVVFSDYFSCILGLVRNGNSWSLNPFDEIRNEDHSVFERGRGNVCSVEFNCLYRWHATTSEEDEKWVIEAFNNIFEGKPAEQVSPADFKAAAGKIQAMQPDIYHWTFGRLQRQEDGTFKDEDLANIIQNATEQPAGAFRARGTPAIMRLHEIMGIEQNRRWGVCSLNDFRKYLGLKPYKSFKEWNPDPEIADAAEKLYGHIDYLELYVGLQAEEAKPVMDGAGLCPGYTISRAILSDAIALTRGDRFFTHDYTPYNLTAWGFVDCQRDPNAFGFGSTLGRLFLRTLPDHFTEDSVYTFFPLMTPDSMKEHLTKMKVIDQYDLERPKPRSQVKVIQKYSDVKQVLEDNEGFAPPYAGKAARVMSTKGFYVVEDADKQDKIVNALADSQETIDKIGQYFYDTTRTLIVSSSYSLVGGKTRAVDLVRDVLKVVPVLWAATDVAGLPLKTKEHPHGLYTPDELYDILGEIYAFVFLDVEPAKLMVNGGKVRTNVSKLLTQIKQHASGHAGQRGSIAGLAGIFAKSRKSDHSELVRRLSAIEHSTDERSSTLLGLLAGSTVELSLALTNMFNLYLDSDKDETVRAAVKGADQAQLAGYVREVLRLDPPFQGVYRTAKKDQKIGDTSVQKDDRIFLDVAAANLDATIFPEPNTVSAARDAKSYIYQDGLVKRLGEPLTVKIMSEVLRAVYEFENIRRAPGQSGALIRFKEGLRLDYRFNYLDKTQHLSAWPTSLSIQYDVKT